MTLLSINNSEDNENPLDLIEKVVSENNWPFDRYDSEEINVSVEGAWTRYQMWFAWKIENQALQFSCAPWAATRRPGPSELYPPLVFARAVPTVFTYIICASIIFDHEWHFETLNWLLLGEGNIRDSEYASSYPAFTERTAFDFLVCGPTCQSVT